MVTWVVTGTCTTLVTVTMLVTASSGVSQVMLVLV
jgi:hypothetical protein